MAGRWFSFTPPLTKVLEGGAVWRREAWGSGWAHFPPSAPCLPAPHCPLHPPSCVPVPTPSPSSPCPSSCPRLPPEASLGKEQVVPIDTEGKELRGAGPRGLPGPGGSATLTWAFRVMEALGEAELAPRTPQSAPCLHSREVCQQESGAPPGSYRQGSWGPQKAGDLVWSLIQVAGPTGSFRTSR